jgi:hypothetical protein
MVKQPLYKHLAQTIAAIALCRDEGNTEWLDKHTATLCHLQRAHLPSGAGFDRGTKISSDSTPEKLIFETAFHHMNDGGFYDGWTDHRVTVTPSLVWTLDVRVSGKDRNGVKGTVNDTFYDVLMEEIEL